MIKDIFVFEYLNGIFVSWKKPKFLPFEYEIQATCYQSGCSNIYTRMERIFNPTATEGALTNILPSSFCEIKFLATYNRARIDPGITRMVSTPATRKEVF